MKSNPGTPCAIYDVAGFTKEAHNIAFSKKNMESAFKATGIFPFNREIYTDEDFLPAEVTNIPDPTVSDETQQIKTIIVHSVNFLVTNIDPFSEQTPNLQLQHQPVQMSNIETNKILTPIQNKSDSSNPNYISPPYILPIPQALPPKDFAQRNKKISCYCFDTRKRTPCPKICLLGQETIKKT